MTLRELLHQAWAAELARRELIAAAQRGADRAVARMRAVTGHRPAPRSSWDKPDNVAPAAGAGSQS